MTWDCFHVNCSHQKAHNLQIVSKKCFIFSYYGILMPCKNVIFSGGNLK